MKVAQVVEKEKIIITDKPIPQLDDFNNVLVRILYCGICGSDLPKYFGSRVKQYPLVLGHEFCGIVTQGPKKLVGKLVAVKPMIYCNKCEHCKSGNYHLCNHHKYIGSTLDGGMQEYIAVPEGFVMEIPGLQNNPMLGALIEPCAVAIHSIKKLIFNNDLYSKKISIIGDGVIGNLIYLALTQYYDIDMNNIQMIDKDFKVVDNSYDYCFNCVGNVQGLNTAINSTKSNGTIIMVGIIYPEYFKETCQPQFDRILRKELTILGSWNSNFNSNWSDAIRLITTHQEDYTKIITDIYSLSDVNEAFRNKYKEADHKILKTMIKVS